VKRGGRGPNNWGGVGDETLDAYSETVAQERAIDNNEAAPAESAQPAEGESPVEIAQPDTAKDNKPEEEKTISLKEYRESQEKDLASIELPKPRQAGEDSNDTWKNCQVLKKDAHNLKLSVIAPTKEKKKGPESNKENTKTESPATKTKSRGSKVPVEQVFHIKAEPRQDNRRREREHEHKDKTGQSPKTKPAPAAAPAAKIDKNSKDFPALAPVKN
jgi:hypothetical protein